MFLFIVHVWNHPNKYKILYIIKQNESVGECPAVCVVLSILIESKKKAKKEKNAEWNQFISRSRHNSITYDFNLNYFINNKNNWSSKMNLIMRQIQFIIRMLVNIEYICIMYINLRVIHFANLFVINYFRPIKLGVWDNVLSL